MNEIVAAHPGREIHVVLNALRGTDLFGAGRRNEMRKRESTGKVPARMLPPLRERRELQELDEVFN